ncbi:MAG: EAL domain-containing protein [Marivibrio sp.]|uniref:EAL domain-containing protein n=1 Tax=Marivibrio sp. TaxID=2039719 RepID=UPI0032ED7040
MARQPADRQSTAAADGADPAADRRFQLYIDEGGEIGIAKGATGPWLGAPPSETTGRNLVHFLAEESHFSLSDILCSAALRQPLEETVLWVKNRRSGKVAGCIVRGGPQTFNQYFRLVFDQQPSMEYGPQSKNSRQGFTKAIAEAVAAHTADGDAEKDLDLTFVDVGDVRGLEETHGVDAQTVRGFTRQVEERLRREAVDETVGRVRPGRYGVVHRKDLDLAAVREDLERYARSADPQARALAVDAATMTLEHADLSPDAVESAVDYALGGFEEAGLDAVIFDTLGDSQTAYLNAKRSRLQILQEGLAAEAFEAVFRPIVDPQAMEADHLLAEFRIELDDDGLGASEILGLTADRPDLRLKVDQAICKRLLTDPALEDATVAVDLAIRSLLDAGLVRMLLDFSRRMGARRLILRLSGLQETAVERVQSLDTLRRAGFGVALYGREIGPVTEERLKRLPIDFILLDPSFVVDLETLRHAAPSLNAMTQRCLAHKVGVIFEGVMEAAALRILSRIKGGRAAGPYFGQARGTIDRLTTPLRRR